MAGAPGYLGPYHLLNVIHTGHSSIIWQAMDDANKEMVGIKTLRSLDDREETRFLRHEYEVGRNTQHARIIEIRAFDRYRGQPYLVMEWLASPNLKQRMQQGMEVVAPLIPTIIESSLEALSYFHSMGWIHRDVKPENFLVSDDGTVKLIDFALARRRLRGIAKWFTRRTKVQQGTRSYMSPEQIRGQVLDERADLYAFACTIYELISGKPPFTGATVNELLMKHLRATPPSLEAVQPAVSPAFAQLIRRTLAKDRNQRPKTGEEFLREFRMMRVFRRSPVGNS